MTASEVLMRRMLGSDAFNVWTKQFTRGFHRCDIVDYFEKLSDSMLQEIYVRDYHWHRRFCEDLKIGERLTIRIPQRLRT